MEMKMVLALIVLCMGGAAFAATASTGSTSTGGAVLQITDYSTVPATVYPGTSGYVKFTVENTGTETATGLTVQYTYAGTNTPLSFSAGDISAGSSSQLTVPFKMPAQVAGGLYTVNIDVYYSSASASGSSKRTSISVPIIASQYGALEVATRSSDRSVMAPGETLQLELEVKNKGGVVNNLVVAAPENSSFSLEGTTQQSIGSIPSGSGANVTLSLVSSSTAAVGQYTIPLLFTYQDALGATATQTLYVGPVSILEPSTQFRLSMDPITPTEVGSQAEFELTLKNTGTSPLNAIIDINSTDTFTPLGVSRIYFEPLAPGRSASQKISLGISNSVSAGYYTLPLYITLGSGKATTQNVGIPVSATPEVTISVDTTQSQTLAPGSDGKVLVQISNTGNSAIRSVYATAERGDFTISGSSDKFIGTLNVDDFATFQISVRVPQNLKAGTHTIPVAITFKDTNNAEHTVKKNVEVQVYGADMAGTAGNATSFNGRGAQSRGLFGIDWLPLGAGLIVLAVIAYFAYGHFKKKEKKGAAGHQHETEKGKEKGHEA